MKIVWEHLHLVAVGFSGKNFQFKALVHNGIMQCCLHAVCQVLLRMPACCLLGSSIHIVIISLVYLLLSSFHILYFMLHWYLTTTFFDNLFVPNENCYFFATAVIWIVNVPERLLLPGVGLPGACSKWKAGDTEMPTSLLLPCCHGNQAFFFFYFNTT